MRLNSILLNISWQGIEGGSRMEVGLRGYWMKKKGHSTQHQDLVSRPILPVNNQGSDRSYSISSISYSSTLKHPPHRVTLMIKRDNAWKMLCKQEPTLQCYFLIQFTIWFGFLKMDNFLSSNRWGREEVIKITFSEITEKSYRKVRSP